MLGEHQRCFPLFSVGAGNFPHTSLHFYALGNSRNASGVLPVISVGPPATWPWNPPSLITVITVARPLLGVFRPQRAPHPLGINEDLLPAYLPRGQLALPAKLPTSRPRPAIRRSVASHRILRYPLRLRASPPQPPPYTRLPLLRLYSRVRSAADLHPASSAVRTHPALPPRLCVATATTNEGSNTLCGSVAAPPAAGLLNIHPPLGFS